MRSQAGRDRAERARILTVTRKRVVADGLIELICEPADGAALPRWAPGAHVDLVPGPAMARPYSLCGDPDDTRRWRFLVRRRGDSGVSAYLHDRLTAGDTVAARGPRDRFPLASAARYLFLASGAGIAPLLPMAARVRAARIYPRSLLLLDRGTAAGPLHRGDLNLYRQRFDNPAADRTDGRPCELVLARAGGRVRVPAGTPLLRALLEAGVAVPWACGSGICGACVLPVIDGKIRHRDAVLTPAERGAGRLVVTCVSTAESETLVLDV